MERLRITARTRMPIGVRFNRQVTAVITTVIYMMKAR